MTASRRAVSLGREPAQWTGLFSAAVMLFSALILPLTDAQQGALNAVAVVVAGLVTALAVSAEKAAPLVAGLIQSLIALALAFGFELSTEMQGAVMTFVAAAVALYLRTQVVAPAPAEPASQAHTA